MPLVRRVLASNWGSRHVTRATCLAGLIRPLVLVGRVGMSAHIAEP